MFAQLIMNSLIAAGWYALVALGFTVIFSASRLAGAPVVAGLISAKISSMAL